MDRLGLRQLLEDVSAGTCSPDDAMYRLRRLPFADLGFARVDHHRVLRQRIPEAVYAQGKTPEQCSLIVSELLRAGGEDDRPDGGTGTDTAAGTGWASRADPASRADRTSGSRPGSPSPSRRDARSDPRPDARGDVRSDPRPDAPINARPEAGAGSPGEAQRELHGQTGAPVILTRADEDQLARVVADHPGGTATMTGPATGADRSRGELATVAWRQAPERTAGVLIVTAGTSDLPVARECSATLVALGFRPTLLADCGVAGVHRLLASVDELADADAIVVVAGMEGALASLVGGVTPAPVVAVPTSTGYGAGLEGVTALLAMHASCASGIAVVGIDNGYGAACAVARMLP